MWRRIYNRFITSAILLAGGMSFGGCTTDNIHELSKSSAEPTLTLEIVRSGAATRANGSEFTAAEKLVSSVDLFFFKEQQDDAKAVYYTRVTAEMNQPNESEDRSNEGKIKMTIPLEGIFFDENGTQLTSDKCYVYAAINTDATKDLDWQNLTLSDLKDIKANSERFVSHMLKSESESLKLTDAATGKPDGDFEGFVMFSSNENGDEITFSQETNKITGTIHVDKLASKIDLLIGFGSDDGKYGNNYSISGKDPNDSNSEIKQWYVYNDSGDAVEAFIVNGVKSVRLGGYNASHTSTSFLASEDYFDLWYEDIGSSTEGEAGDAGGNANANTPLLNYARGFTTRVADSDADKYPYVIEAPFYTYPNEWTTDVLEQHRTYLILKVNWIPDDGNGEPDTDADLLETYYKIPFNVSGESTNKILANHYYRVKAKINTLGGRHFGEPVVLEDCSVEILPWGATSLKADLRETRYLEVRQEVYDSDGTAYTAIMNNTKTVKIPFYSSHKVEISEATITYYDCYHADLSGRVSKPQVISNTTNFTLSKSNVEDDKYTYAGVYIDDINNYIIVQHDFHPINDPNGSGPYTHTSENTYSEYDIHIKLKHKDLTAEESDSRFNLDEINIRQYPAMYVETDFNGGETTERDNWFDAVVGGIFDWIAGTDYGYAFVNGQNEGNRFKGVLGIGAEDIMYGGVNGIADGWLNGFVQGSVFNYTKNPIMYSITATSFSPEVIEEFGYPLHIGDPRVNHVDNDLTSNRNGDGGYDDLVLRTTDQTTDANWNPAAVSVKVWNGTSYSTDTRKLRYYYPTDETNTDENKYMVAPRYKVASSYSTHAEVLTVSQTVDRQAARRRCASYQENGYPAGRWRLPTKGELIYIAQMSKKNIIPPLFNSSAYYWSANGIFRVNADGTVEEDTTGTWFSDNPRGHTRCVYDEWYWGNEKMPDIKNFYWGDQPKNNPQEQPQ